MEIGCANFLRLIRDHVPVAHYHLRAKPIGKSGSTNAVAAAAYRSGSRGVVASAAYRAAERLTEDNGRVYDFTNKKGVEEAFILVPKDAPIWASDRGKLWNAAEAVEKRANGRVATELEISLPKELNPEQRRELIVGFIQPLVDRYKIAADIALHVGSDPRNLHAHIQLTHRELGPGGFGDIAHRHTVMRGDKEIPVAGIAATPRDVIKLRKLWENDVNAAYRKAGLDLTVDSRSYQEQGLDIKPQLYLGPERKDNPELEQKRQERAEYNERIMAQRAERERAALDHAHEQRHEKPQHVAEVIEFKQPESARPWFADIIAGWRAPVPQPEPQPERPVDPLAADLMRAITDALGSHDPAEQTARLLEGTDRAVFVNASSEEPQTPFAQSLWRVATSALSSPEPERVLVEGTREAIRRHDLRQRQAEVAREPTAEPPAEPPDARKLIGAPTRGPAEERPTGRQRAQDEPTTPSEAELALRREQDERKRKTDPELVRSQLADLARQHDQTEREIARRQRAGPARAAPPPLVSDEERARLEPDSWADRVTSGWRALAVEDVARELSPTYDRLHRHSHHLGGEIEKAKRAATFARGDVTRGEAAIEDREHDMGKVRRWLHRTQLWPDATLVAAERYKKRADAQLHKREIKLSAIEGEKAGD